MSKQQAENTWTKGLNKDINPNITPNDVLTDNLNGTFITYNGNEFSLQNDMGNVYTTKLTEGFYPIGMTEYGGIVYIASLSSGVKTYLRATPDMLGLAVTTIVNTVNGKAEDLGYKISFTEAEAQQIFTKEGFLVSNDLYKKLLKTAMDIVKDLTLTVEWIDIGGTKLELGTFPSLAPENIKVEDLDDLIETERDFEYVYRPLHNLIKTDSEGNQTIDNFSTSILSDYDVEHPVSIEIQPSYDGSVNIILNDDKNPPRMINSGFAVIENGKGKFTKRNQGVKTNYYDESKLESESLLISTSCKLTTVDLGVYEDVPLEISTLINSGEELTAEQLEMVSEWNDKLNGANFVLKNLADGIVAEKYMTFPGVTEGGQLKGGNYTFYFKYGDEDGNQTDIICESGIISIFKGVVGKPNTISGAFQNEETDKMIHMTLNDVDINYSKVYVYYTREYCDSNGIRTYECKAIQEPYKVENTTEHIVITGLETTDDISIEDLNVYYHTVSSAKASAQQQNMLFLGNVTSKDTTSAKLQDFSYDIEIALQQSDNIGTVDVQTYAAKGGAEYYDPFNVYYKLGYWPDEIYRLGIVYIKSDGSTTQAYNLRGCEFKDVNDTNLSEGHITTSGAKITSEDGVFIDGTDGLDNICGVFKLPKMNILSENEIKPLCFRAIISDTAYTELASLGVVGYFIVRQKRLPITICQGFGIGVDRNAYIPMIYSDADTTQTGFVAESFLSDTAQGLGVNDLSAWCAEKGIDASSLTSVVYVAYYLDQITKYLGTTVTSVEDPILLETVNKILDKNYTSVRDLSFAKAALGLPKLATVTSVIGNVATYHTVVGYIATFIGSLPLVTRTATYDDLVIAKYLYKVISQNQDKLADDSDTTAKLIAKRRLIYYPVSIENDGESVTINQEYSKQAYIYSYFTYTYKKQQGSNNDHTYNYYASVIAPKDDDPDYIWYTSTAYPAKGKNNTDDRNTAEANAIAAAQSWLDTYYDEYSELYGWTRMDTVSKTSRHKNRDATAYIQELDASANKRRIIPSNSVQLFGQGLLSVEAMTNYQIQSALNGSELCVSPVSKCEMGETWPLFYAKDYSDELNGMQDGLAKVVYVPEDTSLKYFDKVGFSTLAGDGVNPNQFKFLKTNSLSSNASNINVVRGKYTPFIGVYTKADSDNKGNEVQVEDQTALKIGCIAPNFIYDVRVQHSDTYKNEVTARANNQDSYFAITDRTALSLGCDIYRGDCFTNTVTIRMHRNFIDESVPTAETIIDPTCWEDHYHGIDNIAPDTTDDTTTSDKKTYTEWDKINIGDLNTVSLGHWVTFKCLASSNLGLRSEDTSNTTERVQLGNSRGFYPFSGLSTATGMKLPDSTWLNDGYNATVSRKRYTLKQDTPYDKNEYDTRIIFSNIAVNDSFTNGYRTFQGASYHDYTKQYGSIVKLISFGNNLFCAFEHGLAIIPVNEKALIQTTTEQSIHIYGHGVLPDTLSVISQDLGSIWADSIIRTPMGIYGVDTSCKKIWQYTDKSGLRTLSDMTVQRFLNDNINLNLARQESLGLRNVKTHYNNYKGDVMFTFYNDDKQWNLCYNERQDLWVTRYDWIPLFSVNIDNSFYSLPLVSGVDLSESIGIWKHGRTGIDKQILPTKWYGEQHPFEYEFVVNTPAGVHKIFENLAIMSNNVQPVEIDFEFVGDAYLFNKARIYHDASNLYGLKGEDKAYIIEQEGFNKDNYAITDFTPMFKNATVNYDHVLDEYTIAVKQTCKNKESYGLRLGNIQYKEDCWFTNIEPLRYNLKLNSANYSDLSSTDAFGSAKLRDKWIKIKIKYAGDRLAIVNGVVTNENISYA